MYGSSNASAIGALAPLRCCAQVSNRAVAGPPQQTPQHFDREIEGFLGALAGRCLNQTPS